MSQFLDYGMRKTHTNGIVELPCFQMFGKRTPEKRLSCWELLRIKFWESMWLKYITFYMKNWFSLWRNIKSFKFLHVFEEKWSDVYRKWATDRITIPLGNLSVEFHVLFFSLWHYVGWLQTIYNLKHTSVYFFITFITLFLTSWLDYSVFEGRKHIIYFFFNNVI